MKGTSIKVGLALVLFVIAGIGFWTNRGDRTLYQGVPSAVREFVEAISDGNERRVASILEDRPDLINAEIHGEPMLLVAARHNKPAIITFLLKHGADRNARGDWRGTALHWACWWGAKDAAERLINEGFSVEDRSDAFNATPLLWAAQASSRSDGSDFEGTVRMLIAHGAAVDTCDRLGSSALSVASQEVAKVLMEHGAKPQSPTTRPSRNGLAA